MLGKKGSEDAGEGEQLTLFWVIELIVCVTLLVGFGIMASRIIADTDEDLIAKDLGLAIMTVSASPGDIFYMYSPNTEGYRIQVTETEVIVKAGSTASYLLMPLPGIAVIPRTIGKTLSVPIIKTGKEISFSDIGAAQANVLCSQLTSSFPAKPSLRIETMARSDEEQKYLKIMKQLLESMLKDGYDTAQPLDPDVHLTLGFAYNNNIMENRLTVKFREKDAQFQSSQKISCNIYSVFRERFDGKFISFEDLPAGQQESEGITILLGSSDVLATLDYQKELNDYAAAVRDAMAEARKK